MNKMNKVTQFQLHGWVDNSPPTNSIVAGLISMITEIQKVQCLSGTNDNPMIIHCRYTYICNYLLSGACQHHSIF